MTRGSVKARARGVAWRGRLAAALLAAGLIHAPGRAHALENVGDLTNVLATHGILFDVETARQAAIEGMLKAIDPSARVLTTNEALKIGLDVTALSSAVPAAPPATNIAAGASDSNRLSAIEKAEEWSHGIAYIKLRGLPREAGAEVTADFRRLARTPDRCGIILDIRGIRGDDLASVDELASLFEGAGAVLYKVLDGSGQEVAAHPRKAVPPLGAPLMVLVDQRTTGTAELLAAVLNSKLGVMLIGSPTPGDNALRELIPLPDGRLLYIASKRAVLPDGSNYGTNGVEPDVVVTAPAAPAPPAATGTVAIAKSSAKGASDDAELRARVGADAAMGRAVDILLGLKALGVHAVKQTDDSPH